jgi:hypothetical protein
MAAGLVRACQYSGAGQLLTGSGDEGALCAWTETIVESVMKAAKEREYYSGPRNSGQAIS